MLTICRLPCSAPRAELGRVSSVGADFEWVSNIVPDLNDDDSSLAAMAQWEREEIAERMAASIAIRAKLGKPLGGNAPYGYEWKGREMVPEPKEAPVRKLLYELFLKHRRKKTVARLLNEAGHRTRNGSEWSDTSVDRLLRDPTAKGQRRANYTRQPAGEKAWTLKPESDWVWSPVEPIISEDLWARCNAILDERMLKRRRPGRKSNHLFAGLTYCGCGAKMYVPSNTPKYVCDRCRTKIPTADLEAVFQEQLRGFICSPEEVARYLASADQAIMDKEELARTLAKEAEKIRSDMDRITRAYVDDEISKDGYGRQYRPLETRLKQIEDELPRLQGEVDFLKIQHLSRDQAILDTRDLAQRWPELPPDAQRQIVENVTERITVAEDQVTIDLLYLVWEAEGRRQPAAVRGYVR